MNRNAGQGILPPSTKYGLHRNSCILNHILDIGLDDEYLLMVAGKIFEEDSIFGNLFGNLKPKEGFSRCGIDIYSIKLNIDRY